MPTYDRYPAVDENLELPPTVMQPNQALAISTATRDALPAARKWDGRQIYNTTLKRYERWDSTNNVWRTLADQQDLSTLLTTTGLPLVIGNANRGVSSFAARSDHVHPSGYDAIDLVTTPNITIPPGVSNTGDGTRAWRKNGVVTLEIYVAVTGGSSVGNVVVMPATWRPAYGTRFNMNSSSNTGVRACLLNPSGEVYVEGLAAAGLSFYGSVTYVTA